MQAGIIESFNRIKHEIGIDGVHVDDALTVFKKYNVSGLFTRRNFKDVFVEIINQYGVEKEMKQDVFDDTCATLYTLFDHDGNGVVDIHELFAGISILFAGNETEKIRVAFELYDESEDGLLQFDEFLAFLASYFTVVMSKTKTNIKPADIARATAKKVFSKFDQDVESGALSID